MTSWLLNCSDVTNINELTDEILQTMDYSCGPVLPGSHIKRHAEIKGGMLGPTDEIIHCGFQNGLRTKLNVPEFPILHT